MPTRKTSRLKAGLTVKNIPPGVYKIRHYWGLLLRHLEYYSSFDKFNFWRGIISGLLKAPLGVGTIYVTGLFVDSIVNYYLAPAKWTITLGSFAFPTPLLYLFLIFILGRLVRILKGIVEVSSIHLRNNVIGGYRVDVADKFHKLNSQEIDREQVKSALTKIDSYWYSSATSFYTRLTSVGEFVVTIIMSLIALFAFSPLIAFFALIASIPEIYVLSKHNKRHAAFVEDISPLLLEKSYYFNALTDARTFPERKINGVFKALLARFEQVATAVAEGYKRVLSLGEKQQVVLHVVDNIFIVILKGFVVVSEMVDRVAVGKITATIGYIDSLYGNAHDLYANLVQMYDELTFIEYLYDFFDISGFADQRLKGKHLKEKIPAIEFQHVNFSYPDNGRVILHDASMEVKPGDRVMILGRDGTGKSSLLALLAGLYQISGGEICFDGIPQEKLARRQVKNKMSVVPEDFARYYLPVRDNIVLGDPKKAFDAKLYKKALEITGLDVWMKENNISDTDTVLGNYFRDSVSISSGHWQRLAIARAIYRNREIFLLDQPFTYIDSHSTEEILPKLLDFVGKRTVIFISEHTWHEKYFNKVFELEEQKLKLKK